MRRVGNMLRSALGWFTVLTALYGLVVPAMVGWLTANYSPSRQYISELGAMGAPQAYGVNMGIFLPTGLLALGAVIWLSVALPREMKWPVLLLLGIGLGNLGAVAFPCDAGCPAEGSARQGVHNLLGAIQYLSGGGALVWLGRRGKLAVCLYAGLGVWASLYLMGGPGQEMRGFWQRVGEVLLYSSLPYLAWSVRRVSVGVRQGIP